MKFEILRQSALRRGAYAPPHPAPIDGAVWNETARRWELEILRADVLCAWAVAADAPVLLVPAGLGKCDGDLDILEIRDCFEDDGTPSEQKLVLETAQETVLRMKRALQTIAQGLLAIVQHAFAHDGIEYHVLLRLIECANQAICGEQAS